MIATLASISAMPSGVKSRPSMPGNANSGTKTSTTMTVA
jgi:hypothetical protein